MKNLLLTISLLLALNNLLSAEKKFIIEGNITNIPDSAIVTLSQLKGMQYVTIVADTIINGKFRLEGTTDTVTKYLLSVSEQKDMSNMEDTNIWLPVGDNDYIYIGTPVFPESFSEIWVYDNVTKITGNSILYGTWDVASNLPEQKEENLYTEASKTEIDSFQLCSIERRKLVNQAQHPNIDRDKRKQIGDKVDALDSIRDRLDNQMRVNALKVMAKSKIGTVGLENLSGIAKISEKNPELIKPALAQYKRLSKEQKNSETGINIYNKLHGIKEYIPTIGDNMIDAILYDTAGAAHTLSSIKNKYMLLDFWDSGCLPCIQSIPELKNIEKDYAKTLQIVSVSLDIEETWKRTSKSKELAGLNLKNDKDGIAGFAKKYGVNSRPTYILISPDHKIVAKTSGYGKGSIIKFLEQNNIPKE